MSTWTWGLRAVAVGSLAFLLAACGGSSSSKAASAKAARSTGVAKAATVGLTGTTKCEKSGPPASVGQVTDEFGHDHRGPVPQVQIKDAATKATLAQQLAEARTVAQQYPTVADATKAGYFQTTVYVPCIGAHYTNPTLVRPTLDPAHPAELLYDGTTPDAKIVGLSYLLLSNGPPEGFAGPNDHWHQHNFNGGLCMRHGQVIGSEEVSPAQCVAQGGRKVALNDLWMAHVWIVSNLPSPWGLFSPEHPDLGGRIGRSAAS